MIDTVIYWIVARIWRRRVTRHEQRGQWNTEFMAWKREHPNRCMYCAYTSWAKSAQGMALKLEPHYCVEGNSPPHPLPRARVIV